MRRLAFFVLVAAALVACGEPQSEATTVPPTSQTTEEQVETTAVPTTAAVTTTIAADAAPPEMEGPWVGEIEGQPVPFDQAHLTLEGTNYATSWGPDSHGGTISVIGDTIYFTNFHCEGSGAYRWDVDGDTLTFNELEPDRCPRRVLLNGVTYTRR